MRVSIASKKVAMKAGSCAAKSYEPRQVRKEAAVSMLFRVPQVNLAGANYLDSTCSCKSKSGARSINNINQSLRINIFPF